MKITTLTEAQKDKFPVYVKKWTDIGLSTEAANRPKAEEAINKCYEKAGIKPPSKIVWCGSPLSQSLVRYFLINLNQKNVSDAISASVRASVYDSVWASVYASVCGSVCDSVRDSVSASVYASVCDSVRASVYASVRDSVYDSVYASVWASVCVSVCDSVRDSVYDSVWASVYDSVYASVWASVYASVRDSVRDSVYASVWASVCGSQETYWLSFFSYMRDELDLAEETEAITGLLDLSLHCGWILPFNDICFASERHNVLNRDLQGRIHCEDGPAISYPDGWNIYAVHGTLVPSWIIEDKESITFEKINSEENAEIRRIMTDIYGEEKYVSHFDPIQKDEFGELYKAEFKDDEPIVKVKVYDSTTEADGTRRTYFISVDKDTQTAKQGVAKSFGFDNPEDYKPVIES